MDIPLDEVDTSLLSFADQVNIIDPASYSLYRLYYDGQPFTFICPQVFISGVHKTKNGSVADSFCSFRPSEALLALFDALHQKACLINGKC